jgi:hypothetical protein
MRTAHPLAGLDEFTRSYVECALWSSYDESDSSGGRPMDENYSTRDLAPSLLAMIVEECRRFQAEHAQDLAAGPSKILRACTPLEYAGHDFWLTRNHHGCGFWDGDWPEEAGERLTSAAHAFRQLDLYIGDDGMIYA